MIKIMENHLFQLFKMNEMLFSTATFSYVWLGNINQRLMDLLNLLLKS